MIDGIVESFSELPDPRCPGRVRHRFIDTLVIAVCAVIAGAETWIDIATYGVMGMESAVARTHHSDINIS